MSQQNLQPVAMQERIQTIDIIRGVALFGILIINFTVDNRNVQPEEGWTGLADQLTYWPIRFFLDDKFMAMYCFLFGLGFSIQMLRAQARNSPFVFVYIRRLIALYFIGTIHNILTSESILPAYAMVGVLLLLLYKLPRKLLPVLAMLCFLIPTARDFIKTQEAQSIINNTGINIDTLLLDACVGVYERDGEPGRFNIMTREGKKVVGQGRGGKIQLIAKSETEFFIKGTIDRVSFLKDSTGIVTKLVIHPSNGNVVRAQKIQMDIQKAQKEMDRQMAGARNPRQNLTYKQFIVKNTKEIWQGLKNWSWSNFFWGSNITSILPLFLMGLYFGRRKIFYDISLNRIFLHNVMKWGLIIGGSGVTIFIGIEAWNVIIGKNWNWGYSIFYRDLINLSWNIGVMLMALGYIAGLTLLLEKIDWKKRLSFLAPVGRMGLTNYILHTIPYVFIFHYGLNLSGKIGPFYRLLFALPVFVSLIFISRWWFKHFRIGPVEWLWRSLTYLKFQPMRLKPSDKKEDDKNII